LNNNLDGFNIEFFEDENESIWMMANAYYKLISDFIRKSEKVSKADKKEKETTAAK
jgi:plasmid segregation protein ParM